jgi:cytochrome c5
MLNILKNVLLAAAAAMLITACGESETPAAPETSETAPAVAVPEPPPAMETVPEEAASAAETVIETTPESVPEIAEPEPAPVTAPAEPAAPAAPAAEAPAPTAAEAPAAAITASIDGGQIYNTYCAICHRAGMNAAPKFGSKPLWAKRIAQGRETVYAHAINGLRGMPPRGGFAQLTDDEVKAATDYMVKAAGGWGDN